MICLLHVLPFKQVNRTDAASGALTAPELFNNHQCLNTKEALSYLVNVNHNCFGE